MKKGRPAHGCLAAKSRGVAPPIDEVDPDSEKKREAREKSLKRGRMRRFDHTLLE